MAGLPTLCPHRGIDLRKDELVVAGGLMVDPRGDATLDGQPIHLTRSERVVLMTLVKARGRTISADALLERTGSEAHHRIADVWISRLRKKLAGFRPDRVFVETVTGLGYRWVGGKPE